jgi:hypothetical protein
MDRIAVHLSNQEWGQVMFVLANAEGKGINWSMVNPLLMAIGDQLRVQAMTQGLQPGQAQPGAQPPRGNSSKEVVQ